MTIDERLEAFTQTVDLSIRENRDFWRRTGQAFEFLLNLHRDTESRFAKTDERFAKTDERFAKTDERIADFWRRTDQAFEVLLSLHRDTETRFSRNEERMGHVMDAVTRLTRIAENHEENGSRMSSTRNC